MKAFYKDKDVLVTGGAGVIGTELMAMLLDAGANILCADLKPRPHGLDPRVAYIQGDANYLTTHAVRDFAPQICVHLAATFERAIETEDFWDENFWHNVRLSHHVMTLLKDEPRLERVIFASSYLIYDSNLYMFDAPQDAPFVVNEQTPIDPRNICGAAKLMHEIELRFLTHFESCRFSSVSARIFRVYGKGSRDIVSRWVRTLIKDPEATLTLYGKEAMFDYVYAGDVAEGLLRLGATDHEGICNLGSGVPRRVEELVKALESEFPGAQVEERPTDIQYEAHQADLTRLEALTGWRPQTTLEAGIKLLRAYEETAAEDAWDDTPFNVLITSASRKVPLIERYQEALDALAIEGDVWGADLDGDCVASYFADAFWAMPRLGGLTVEALIDFCDTNAISLIVPTRDGELEYFAEHRAALEEAGVAVLVGDKAGVTRCLDKLTFYVECQQHGIPCIPTFDAIDAVNGARLVVKERFGAGSRTIGIDLDPEAAARHAEELDSPIFQPYIDGTEYSINLYVNNDGDVVDVVPRVRARVHSGESVVSETREHPAMIEASLHLAKAFGLRGHAVLQAFDTDEGPIFIECNPRVGGASALAFEAGLDTPRWSILEALGEEVEPRVGSYQKGLKLVRYSSDRFLSS